MDTEALDNRLRKLVGQRSMQLAECILPIFSDNEKGVPIMEGTGFLVSDGQSTYLVTAAHVVDPIKLGTQMYIYGNENTKVFLNGKALLSTAPAGDREQDRVDIAVLKFAQESVAEINAKVPVNIERLSPCVSEKTEKLYLVVGFPETRSRANTFTKTVFSRVMAFWNSSATIDLYEKLRFSPATHTLIAYDRKRIVGSQGKIEISPDPHGMSGCPVWLLSDEQQTDSYWDEPVVGIIIEHNKLHKCLIATGPQHALRMIREGFKKSVDTRFSP